VPNHAKGCHPGSNPYAKSYHHTLRQHYPGSAAIELSSHAHQVEVLVGGIQLRGDRGLTDIGSGGACVYDVSVRVASARACRSRT
jgi:hypothetical protein